MFPFAPRPTWPPSWILQNGCRKTGFRQYLRASKQRRNFILTILQENILFSTLILLAQFSATMSYFTRTYNAADKRKYRKRRTVMITSAMDMTAAWVARAIARTWPAKCVLSSACSDSPNTYSSFVSILFPPPPPLFLQQQQDDIGHRHSATEVFWHSGALQIGLLLLLLLSTFGRNITTDRTSHPLFDSRR